MKGVIKKRCDVVFTNNGREKDLKKRVILLLYIYICPSLTTHTTVVLYLKLGETTTNHADRVSLSLSLSLSVFSF